MASPSFPGYCLSLGSSQSPVELLSGTALAARLGESQARPLLRLSAATCGDPTGLRIQGLFRCDRELPALAEQVVERFAEQRLARPSFLSRDDPQLAADRFGKVCGNGDDAGAARPGGWRRPCVRAAGRAGIAFAGILSVRHVNLLGIPCTRTTAADWPSRTCLQGTRFCKRTSTSITFGLVAEVALGRLHLSNRNDASVAVPLGRHVGRLARVQCSSDRMRQASECRSVYGEEPNEMACKCGNWRGGRALGMSGAQGALLPRCSQHMASRVSDTDTICHTSQRCGGVHTDLHKCIAGSAFAAAPRVRLGV